ncbi:MAG: TlpA family protein disulfide reductase [Deltaproteobacteria bacterium]|nr:TlpA family protein disulfide reductase [Deltaproteobacteria bacterium]
MRPAFRSIATAIAGVSCLGALAGVSCSAAAPPAKPPAAAQKESPLQFDLEAVDGTRVSSETTRARNTVIGFITTYDLASQALANYLKTVAREHVPRTNVVAIVLEAPESLPLVKAFATTIRIKYPLVLVEPRDHARSVFKDMKSVPSVLILDREGRPSWRKNGIVEAKEIDQVLRGLE